jgi:hypothetical protein
MDSMECVINTSEMATPEWKQFVQLFAECVIKQETD